MPKNPFEFLDSYTKEDIDIFFGRDREIKVKRGDSLCLFSDGYADQFGGPKNKKFGYKSFRKLMIDIQDHIMFEQQRILEQTFNEW